MIYLKLDDEQHLHTLQSDLTENGIKCSSFKESDMQDQHTALACIDTGERFKHLKLL